MMSTNFDDIWPKSIFSRLVKKIMAKKLVFGEFLKSEFLNLKSDTINRFLVKFPFIKFRHLFIILY